MNVRIYECRNESKNLQGKFKKNYRKRYEEIVNVQCILKKNISWERI